MYSRLWITLALVAIMLASTVMPVLGAPEAIVRVWVTYTPGQGPPVRLALSEARATFHYDFPDLDAYVITLPAAALNGIRNNPRVVDVEPDPERHPIPLAPSTLAGASLAAVNAGNQVVPYGVDMVQARDVWDVNRDGITDSTAPTGANRTVCIIDSGYYPDHEDLPDVADGYAQVAAPYTTDGYGHGSHVAGTIAAENNSGGVVGVTPGTAGLHIIKFFNNDGLATYASDLVDALSRCRSAGANVVSMSLGGLGTSTSERQAFDTAYAAGVLSIAAAGNDQEQFPNAYAYPASYDSVVSVAAIDEAKSVAPFSQRNNQVELAAPGVGVVSTVPYIDSTTLTVGEDSYTARHIQYSARGTVSGALANGGKCTAAGAWDGKVVLCARGDISFYDKVMNVQDGGGVAAVIYNNEPGPFLGTLGEGYASSILGISLSQEEGQDLLANRLEQTATVSSLFSIPASGYEAWDGTSMATPHVSGVAALVWSANPAWSNVQVREALAASAQDLGPAGRDSAYGYGLVQAAVALAHLDGIAPENAPPSLTISSPQDGASFVLGTPIALAATAADAEDGDPSANILWKEGAITLGTGAAITISILGTGEHTLTASVADAGGLFASDSVTLTVTAPLLPALAAGVTTDKAAYTSPQKATLTVTVRDPGSAPVSGAEVSVKVQGPLGAPAILTGTTGPTGVVILSYRINSRKTGAGTYTVSVTATKAGYAPASAATTFLVR